MGNGHIVKEGIFLFPQHHGGHAEGPALQLALALGDDVRGCDEACHAHIAAEELVLDGMDVDLDHGVLAVQLVHHPGDEGGRHGPRHHIHLLGAEEAVGLCQLREELLLEQPHHADAVLQLVVVAVEGAVRDGTPGLQVPLVAGVDDPLAVAAEAFVAELLHDVDDGSAGLGVVGRLFEQVLAVIGHTAGHRRDALHHRRQLQQVAQGAAQLVAVVDAPAEHQLAVHRDAALHKAGQVLEHLARALVGQHPHPELGVRGVDRNIDR